MSQPSSSSSADIQDTKLPRRDWVILPLIALTTIALMAGICEFAGRIVWPEQDDTCFIADTKGVHYQANCRSRVKIAEGPWIENAYNNCGYRSQEPCGPKPLDSIRIAVLGSSSSYGYGVLYKSIYTTLASEKLNRECNRHVEFQNLGVMASPLKDTFLRTDEALALKPDLLLLVLDPFDVVRFNEFNPNTTEAVGANQAKKDGPDWLHAAVINPLKNSRSATILEHFMYQNPATYENLYLLSGDTADYLRVPFSPLWQRRFTNLDAMLRSMMAKTQPTNVPLVVLLTPMVMQGALMNTPPRAGIDPAAFNREVTRIASKYDIRVIDPLNGFAGQFDVMNLFYVVNGHLSAEGQPIIAEYVNEALLSGKYAAFGGCRKEESSSIAGLVR